MLDIGPWHPPPHSKCGLYFRPHKANDSRSTSCSVLLDPIKVLGHCKKKAWWGDSSLVWRSSFTGGKFFSADFSAKKNSAPNLEMYVHIVKAVRLCVSCMHACGCPFIPPPPDFCLPVFHSISDYTSLFFPLYRWLSVSVSCYHIPDATTYIRPWYLQLYTLKIIEEGGGDFHLKPA